MSDLKDVNPRIKIKVQGIEYLLQDFSFDIMVELEQDEGFAGFQEMVARKPFGLISKLFYLLLDDKAKEKYLTLKDFRKNLKVKDVDEYTKIVENIFGSSIPEEDDTKKKLPAPKKAS